MGKEKKRNQKKGREETTQQAADKDAYRYLLHLPKSAYS
jgi:hypothetical protein